ncbi:fungal-specific transcription factor domain-containing protein [Rhizoctonia solani]|nr:fungal-specific transcription factor domain-containing protein [Rhizoctonia solani]
MSNIVKFMGAVAPVFRRACPEPMDQYVNLPRAVMSPKINIRHFATSDVLLSATTGRPMLFRYDMTCPPDILELINDGRYGMQWLHGVPDQYIIILARINSLAEELEFGGTFSPHCVTEIENQIREVEAWPDDSADPISAVWRFAVRQCWRMTAYVYLYMVLCRTFTDDPRVLESVNGFVQLMDAVKSGRNPDAFLYVPMVIVGAAAYRKQDRDLIRRRMSGLQECINPDSCGYDALNILHDLWSRTDAENRAADWRDFGASASLIMGM